MESQKKKLYGCLGKLRYGCYIRRQVEPIEPIGPIKQDGMMPLKSSEYEIEIANAVANITLVQTYQNPTEKYLEVQYCFPVNPKACVYRLVATFGNKRSQGIVKQKNQAEKEYKEAIKNGKQASLAKYDPNNNDIINLQIGNVAPNQVVKIEIVYLQELSLSSNMFYELHMTGTIYPRYMAYIPRQALFRGFRDKTVQAKGEFYWNFTIKLRTSKKVNFTESKSHKLVTVAQNDCRTESEFTLEKQCLPDKDFVFTYTTENFEEPSYVLGRTDISSTAMISFIPKFCQLSLNDAYQASLTGTPYQTDIQHARGQYIFLLDRSGSMGGKRIEKAKEALILFIKSLPEDIYFNVVSFGNNSQLLFTKSQKYNDKQINQAVKAIKEMDANMGGTEIYTPLANLLTSLPIQGYPKHIFLLTDGQVSNTNFILDMVESNVKYSRVHTIGIGDGASQQLVVGCAEKGKGHHVFISDAENPSQKIIQLLTDSLSPVISKVNVEFDKNVVESIIPNPNSIPYILKGQIMNFYINFKGQLDKKTSITFSYEDSLNKKPYSSIIQIDPQSPSQSFIDRMGHFKKLQLLQSSYRKNTSIEQYMYYVKIIDKRAEIVNLSIKHQILSSETAFISVEKELVDGKYEEIKSTGQLKMEIKNNVYEEERLLYKNVGSMKQTGEKKKMMMRAPTSTISTLSASSMASSRPVSYKGTGFARMAVKESQIMDESKSELRAKKMPTKKCAERSLKVQVLKKEVNVMKQCFQEQYQNQCIPNEQVKNEKQGISIDNVVFSQLSDGSWKDIRLAETLFGTQPIQQLLSELFNIHKFTPVQIVTCLILNWIEKYHQSKQYSLVVKKGMNFLKRELAEIEPLLSYCKNVKI